MLINLYSGFDWTLEIIDDGTSPNLNTAMLSLINSSVSSKTITKRDYFGLPYPDINPRYSKDKSVEEVVIRSIYSYKFGASGYIVEIAVYRIWPRGIMTEEPRIESGMSMYHPEWDYQMAEVYDTSNTRDWDAKLNCFFRHEDEGIPGFLKEVKFLVSSLLSQTFRNNVASCVTHKILQQL